MSQIWNIFRSINVVFNVVNRRFSANTVILIRAEFLQTYYIPVIFNQGQFAFIPGEHLTESGDIFLLSYLISSRDQGCC